MKLEYLIKSRDNIENYILIIEKHLKTFEKKHISANSFHKSINDGYTIITALVNSENEDTARSLSDLNKEIVKHSECITLVNESAAYFNKRLYPIVNDFERNLRRLLYIASSLNPEEAKDNISGLEEKDFGVLFDLLFLDKDYQNKVKAFVNANNNSQHKWKGFAFDLEKYLKSEKEYPLWDRVLPEEVPTLRTRFNDIKSIRNDVMHAHNIDKERYSEAKRLFENIEKEINETLEKVTSGLVTEVYNLELENAIEKADIQSYETNDSLAEAYISQLKLKKREELLKKLDLDLYNEYVLCFSEAEQQMKKFSKRANQIIETINKGEANDEIGEELALLNIELEKNISIISSKPKIVEAFIYQALNRKQ